MRLGFLLGEIWNGLRRNLSMAISVILVTMVSIFLLGLGVLAQRQADTMKGYWYDRIQVSIFMCTDGAPQPNCAEQAATDSQKATIETQLKAMPEVDAVFHEDAQQAYDRFKEQFRNSPIADTVQVGDINESYRVKLKDPTKFSVVSSQFENAPGVASVQDQEKVLKKFFQVINGVTIFALGLAALMAVCAALLMATTIRQAAFVRRREISIMRLVGASSWTIRMPFVIEMLVVAAIGVGLAVAMLWGAVQVIFNLGVNQVALSQAWIGTSDVLVVAPWLFGGVALVALLTSLLTLRRYLRV
jgi:cell division transport system permease protein